MPLPAGLTQLVTAAITPIGLVTPCAILLSAYFGKHSGLAAQVRELTAERRRPETSAQRRGSLERQLQWFHRRVRMVWSATIFLSAALLLFLVTVFSVLFAEREVRIGAFGAATLVAGLLCIAVAVWLDLNEIVLARRTMVEEIADALQNPLSGSAETPVEMAGDAGRCAE